MPPTNFHAAGVLSNAVPLGWLPPAGLLVEGYNIFGVDEAGVQTPFNSELVQGASYTVTGLENGGEWDFQIQTVAQGGIPSGYVTTRVRVGAPLPVVRLRASLDSSVVHLSWHANADPALTNYRVLRRSDVEGDSATIVTTAVNYDDFEAIVGRTYTYWVVAENSRGLQSFLSDSVVVVPWAPERRILVIDETDSLRGAQILQGGVSADSVAAVYRRLLDATGEAYDYIDQPDQDSPVYTLEMLAQYDVVIWHCESNASTYNLLAVPEREQILQDYIRNGGRMLRIARRLLSGQMAFPPGRYRREQLDQHPFGEYLWPLTFDSVHVADRYLTWQYGIRLTGGASPFPEFPDFVLDTARLHQIQFGGNPHFDFLPEIDVYWPRPETDPLYRAVVHESDTSGLANQPVAVMGYGEILLGFPLYFLHEEDAQAILTASIAWLRAYADVPEPEPVPIPTTLALQQNYPNPFNAATTLKFDLPEAARVQLVIYNLLGQEVRVLADQTMSAGYHTIHWDGSNASGFALPSGLYLARLETEQASQTVKIVLLR